MARSKLNGASWKQLGEELERYQLLFSRMKNSLPKSVYELKKNLKLLTPGFIKLLTCHGGCRLWFVKGAPRHCTHCDGELFKGNTPRFPYNYHPIAPRLIMMFRVPSLARALNSVWDRLREADDSCLGDIWEGELIRNALEDGLVSSGDVLFLGSMDGFLPFGKGVKYSCSPTYFNCLNPPPNQRLHPFWMCLTAVIPGPKKFPSEDAFLIPNEIEFSILNSGELRIFDADRGVFRRLKAFMLNFNADEVQWKSLTHIKAHGAKNCSDKRSFHGEGVEWRDRRQRRKVRYYYPPPATTDTSLRTHDEYCRLALEYDNLKTKKAKKEYAVESGVKEPGRICVLSEEFDVIQGKSEDIMHTVLLGSHLKAIICILKSELPSVVAAVSQVTNAILYLSELQELFVSWRPGGDILDYMSGSPKADAVSAWLIYIAPYACLNLLRDENYSLLLSLKCFYELVSQPQLTKNELEEIDTTANRIFTHVYELFGVESCTYQMQKLIDLAEASRQHGPLRYSSLFVFERYIRRLKRYVNGTKHVENQIAEACELDFATSFLPLFASQYCPSSQLDFDMNDGVERLTQPEPQLYPHQADPSFVKLLRAYLLQEWQLKFLSMNQLEIRRFAKMTHYSDVYHSALSRKNSYISACLSTDGNVKKHYGRVEFYCECRYKGRLLQLAYVQWFNLQFVKARSGESLPVVDLTKETRSQLGDKLLFLTQVTGKVYLLPKKLVQKRKSQGSEVYFVLERNRSSVLFDTD